MWKEYKQSSLILVGIIILLFAVYSVLPKTKTPKPLIYGTKTVEEIVAGSYTKNYKQDNTAWDNTFQSAIRPIEDKNGD